MKNMTLSAIAKACDGIYTGAEEYRSKEVSSVVIDSRIVQQDGLFIAIKGERVDGHSFIGMVKEKGCACVVCESVPKEEDLQRTDLGDQMPYILVKDTGKALRDIAAYYRSQLDVKVVGITGSVGKTSTKEVIASVLAQKFKVRKTQGNFNNEIGVPLTIFSITQEDEIAVVELGINHFNEMHRLGEIARPDVCVYTNIGQCHLENLGSRDGILKAKTELFDHLMDGARVFLNGDDDKLSTIEQVQGRKPVFYGTAQKNDYRILKIELDGIFGSKAVLATPQETFETFVPLPGEHMVYNALAACAVGEYFGMTLAQIDQGIRSVEAVMGRSHVIKEKNYTIIDDCYNANPVSMKAAISLLDMANTRKVAILGDMFELGEKEKELHVQVGGYLSEYNIDVLICVGTLSKNMYDQAIVTCRESRKNTQIYYFADKEKMLEALPTILQPADTVLVKASHGMEFTKVVEFLKEN